MRVYLDIDGVLLNKAGQLAEGAEAFLRWVIEHHEPFWLSTRTRDGTHRGALRAFYCLLDGVLLRAIVPVRWDTLKTEALPTEGDWLWLDDELLHAERDWLVRTGAEDRFVRVNVDLEPDALLRLRW